MPAVEEGDQAARRQLESVLASAGFARNERMAKFLRFVVERHLAGQAQDLKESVIAHEVFGRGTDHNPRRDPIVRTEAARLRARLSEYYLGEGRGNALVIELPKGGYAPVFRQAEPAPVATRSWRFAPFSAACVAVALAAGGWWWFHQSEPLTIAVLPLTNVSQDPTSDYFADGLTGELIRNLSIIEGLAVRSQTSSFALKDKPRNIRDAGQQMDADYILEGSVLRAGQQLRVTAQLVRVRDDFPMWSGRYDRELRDVLAIQDEISHGIVNSLRLKLGNGRRRYEVNAEVYDLYLRARAATFGRGLRGINRNVGALEEVIAKDPSFAPAHADLAAAYATRSGEFAFNISSEMSKMRAAADTAIRLDPLLAQAHYAQGMIHARDAQWEQSETSFRRAIELDPSRSELHMDFALFFLLPLGRMEEAVREARTAKRADPLSPVMHHNLAYILIAAERYDEAGAICAKLPLDLQDNSLCLARARLGQGRVSEAIQVLEASLEKGVGVGSQVRGELGLAYHRAGRTEDAGKIAAATSPQNPFNQSLIFAGSGDRRRTLEALDLAAAGGPFRIGRALMEPEYAFLRGDPRVQDLRRKVGLPE